MMHMADPASGVLKYSEKEFLDGWISRHDNDGGVTENLASERLGVGVILFLILTLRKNARIGQSAEMLYFFDISALYPIFTLFKFPTIF